MKEQLKILALAVDEFRHIPNAGSSFILNRLVQAARDLLNAEREEGLPHDAPRLVEVEWPRPTLDQFDGDGPHRCYRDGDLHQTVMQAIDGKAYLVHGNGKSSLDKPFSASPSKTFLPYRRHGHDRH